MHSACPKFIYLCALMHYLPFVVWLVRVSFQYENNANCTNSIAFRQRCNTYCVVTENYIVPWESDVLTTISVVWEMDICDNHYIFLGFDLSIIQYILVHG